MIGHMINLWGHIDDECERKLKTIVIVTGALLFFDLLSNILDYFLPHQKEKGLFFTQPLINGVISGLEVPVRVFKN